MGSEGGEGRRDVASKKGAIFLVPGPKMRFTRAQHGGEFAAIRRASKNHDLHTKVTDHFDSCRVPFIFWSQL